MNLYQTRVRSEPIRYITDENANRFLSRLRIERMTRPIYIQLFTASNTQPNLLMKIWAGCMFGTCIDLCIYNDNDD